MSEMLNRENRDFSMYDEMETEELEEILRLDAEAPEGAESDVELLLYVMEVLAERRKKANITGNTAQEAWKSFEQNYMPEDALETQPKPAKSRGVRRLIAAAAVIVLVVLIPVSAKALKLDKLWNVVAKWAKETFSFVCGVDDVDGPSPDRKEEVTALQQMLKDSNRDAAIVPTWIPDGFVQEKIIKDITPIQETYVAFYLNGDNALKMRIHIFLEEDIHSIEIEDDYTEIYSVSGTDYYIFKNEDQCRAVWITGMYECMISGDLSVDEIKLMIDSIGKG